MYEYGSVGSTVTRPHSKVGREPALQTCGGQKGERGEAWSKMNVADSPPPPLPTPDSSHVLGKFFVAENASEGSVGQKVEIRMDM